MRTFPPVVRALSLRGRSGDGGAARELSELVAELPLEQQSLVLRAFALYFQLANIAEQHHRLRRRREYEHEGHTPKETLGDAFARLDAAGVGPEQVTYAGSAARLREVWIAVRANLRAVLEHVTIADLAQGELPASIEQLAADPDAMQPR